MKHQRWQYKIHTEQYASIEAAEAALNDLGRDGWELVHMQEGGAVFKRPLPPGV